MPSTNQRSDSTVPRYKSAVVAWAAVYPVVVALDASVGRALAPLPYAVRTLLATGLVSVLLTYVALPFALRLFARWLRAR